jgi:Domain of unknown function (DUF5666)/Domain of unknown function (DUF4382)
MRKAISRLGPLLLVAIVLAGCGGGMNSTLTPSGTNMAQVSLTIHDNPPMGVTVLSFEIEVTGATLQPSGSSSSQPVSMLSEPEDIEIEHLQTESALLASRSVPTGTYSGLMVTFANPRMTIQNQTGAPLTLGTQTCSDQQVCEFDPKLNQSSVTVQAPTQPFPITLTMNSPLVLKMDFNIDTSIQQSDLSITPTISVMQLPPLNSSGGNEGDEDVELIGQIASIDQTMHTFTVQSGMNGPSFTIATDTNTQFDFGTSCSMENFTCLKTGQIVKVDAKMKPDGSLLAFEVKFFQPPNEMSFSGAVTSVNTGTSSFQIVLLDEEFFGGGGDMGSFSMGAPVTITLAPQPTFSVDASGFMFPSGLNFASAADLMVGQEVRLHPTGLPTGTPPNLMVTADQVQLEPSFVTGSVTAVNTSNNPQTFTLGSLPSFFTNAGITSIQVDVLATTQFETEEDQTFSGLSSFKSGDMVSVRGPLFKTMTMPTMAAEKVVNRSMSSGTSD